MDLSVCAVCLTDPADLPRSVCFSCRDKHREALSEVAWAFPALLSPAVRGKSGLPTAKNRDEPSSREDPKERMDRHRGVSAVPEPISAQAIELRSEILDILLGWASLHHERTGSTNPPTGVLERHQGDLDELIDYLSAAEHWFFTSEAADAYVTEVWKLAVTSRRVVAPGSRRGYMIAEHHSDDCAGGDVWARARFTKNQASGMGRCNNCDKTMPVEWWATNFPKDVGTVAYTDLGSVEYFSARHGMRTTVGLIRQWRKRGRLLDPPAMQPLPEKRMGFVVTSKEVLDDFAAAYCSKRLSA